MPLIPSPEPEPLPPGADGWCGWEVEPAALCPDWETYTPAQQELALNIAVTTMWAATGRRFGPCLLTIRPCQSKWIAEQYRAFPVWWTGGPYSGPYPFLYGGQWFNSCGCSSWCCCKPKCEIILPGPVSSVVEVVVGGQVLPSYEYRVDVSKGTYFLVKVSPGCWPTCQNFDQPGTGPDAFQVKIMRGAAVPATALGAAAMLACEIGKSIVGAACALPQRMQSLTRQGVSMELVASEIDVNTFATGIQYVDMVIRDLNPSRRTRPPVVLSPDMPTRGDRTTVIGG
jgi:hypothetical protein